MLAHKAEDEGRFYCYSSIRTFSLHMGRTTVNTLSVAVNSVTGKFSIPLFPFFHYNSPIPILSYYTTGIICVEGMVGGVGHLDYNCVPSVVYTHPVR